MLLLINCEVHTENIRTEVLTHDTKYKILRYEYFPYATNNWLIKGIFSHHELAGNFPRAVENFRKTGRMSL